LGGLRPQGLATVGGVEKSLKGELGGGAGRKLVEKGRSQWT